MSYYIKTTLENCSFEDALERTVESLKTEGFGVLTNIDMKATLKKKLDVNIDKYEILGACNPPFAYKALLEEDKIGLMLPCNVIIQEKDKFIEISAVDPIVSMQGINNDNLAEIAKEVKQKLEQVLTNIQK